jgi:S1-C subfamily serine protease
VVFLRSAIPEQHPSAAVLGDERMGVGVAIAPRAVLTAHYLVMGAASVHVGAFDGRERAVREAAVDHETGFALLHLDGPELRPSPLAPTGRLTPGAPVFLLTCQDENERKGASGHVMVVGPFEAFWEYMLDQAIITTVVNPGLAGAPLFDAQGRLVGVVSLGLSAVGRYSLAIPIDLFLERRGEMEAGARSPDRPSRAWVGFYPQAFDGGVAVTGVVSGGPAEKAGLTRGDLLLSVDGQPVGSLRDLYTALWRKEPGDTLGFQVLRESAILVAEVTAGDRDDFYK